MSWLCWHVGTIADPKIAAVAKRCGNAPKHLVVAFWAYLLEIGAEATPKGSIESLDVEGAAILLDTEEEKLVAMLSAMEGKGMISGCQIVNWNKRQHGKSTERVKAFRERKKQDETVSETECNVSYVSETPTVHNSTEHNSKKESAPKARESVSRATLDLAAEFDAWYAEYPLKVARAKAWSAYRKARKKTDAETLLAGVRRYLASPKRDPDFTAHPATWLNGERWLDAAAAEKPHAAKPKQPGITIGSPEWHAEQKRLGLEGEGEAA